MTAGRLLTKRDGGPAFPHVDDDAIFDGMGLRDYFAAKAMQSLINHDFKEDRYPEMARKSYAAADAMLQERLK